MAEDSSHPKLEREMRMPDLGSMTMDQLGELFAGTVICAVLIFVLIIVYFMLSRRSRSWLKGLN